MRAALQVPAFREGAIRPADYERTLEAIAEQEPPDGWRIERSVWVTPDVNPRGDDPTWSIPRSMPAYSVREAPSGKLSARNAAHDDALERGADAIVTWDSDTVPTHPDVFASLLEALEDPDVAAVNSITRSDGTLYGVFWDAIGHTVETFVPFMHGQCHGMTAAAWRQAGPFSTDLDQTDIHSVWFEEEFRFYRRLEAVGRVEQPADVVVQSDTRRVKCRVERAWHELDGRPMSQWCGERGEKSFAGRPQTRLHGCCGSSARSRSRRR